MTPKQLERARKIIAAWTWTFAKTMPQWPHEYVVYQGEYEGDDRPFEYIERLIQKYGYDDRWGRKVRKYLVIDDQKYWVQGHILNRAKPGSNAEVIAKGKRWLVQNGMRSGPYGRIVRVD